MKKWIRFLLSEGSVTNRSNKGQDQLSITPFQDYMEIIKAEDEIVLFRTTSL